MKGIDDKAKAIADKISKYNTGRVSVSSDDTAVIPKNTAGRSIASSHVVSIVQDKVRHFPSRRRLYQPNHSDPSLTSAFGKYSRPDYICSCWPY